MSKVKYTPSGKTLAQVVDDLTALADAGFEVEFYLEPDAIAAPFTHYPPGVRGGTTQPYIMNCCADHQSPEKVGDTFIANSFVPKIDQDDIEKVVANRLGGVRGH